MDIIFVKNSEKSTLSLPSTFIEEMLLYCKVPKEYTVEHIGLSSINVEDKQETYYVYYSVWDNKDIYNISYSCDSEEICNKIKLYI